MVLRGGVTVEVSLPIGVPAAVSRCGFGVGRREVAMVLRGGVTVEVSLPMG
jgi:hypothetical protein